MHSVSVLALAPVMRPDLGLNFAEFGLLMTAYSAGQVSGSVPAGAFVDRVGVGWALVGASFILIAGAALLTQASGLTVALLALLIIGWGYSIINPATARGVLEWFPVERRATAMGIKQVGVPIGGILGAGNGALVTMVAWSDIMLVVAVLIFINGILCIRLARLPKHAVQEGSRNPLTNIREVMRDWNINRFVLLNGLYNFGQTNFFTFLTLFMRDVALASQPMASLSIGIAQAASAVARIGWGVVSDTVFRGRRKELTVWLGGVAVVSLCSLLWVGPGPGAYLGLGLALLLGVTIASFAPLVQTLAVEATEPRLAGTSMGYNMFGTHIGGMIGPPVFGAIVDASGSYQAGWLVTAAVVCLGVGLLAFGFRERGR